ncbi:MAG: hypothetical protein E6X34_07685 [Clostridium sp.]|uniref:hypothetical protein n=1 Tax=Clostridium sp. TaxID=1506 RepID=UPI00290AC790|nr:hypothetical protein [Clostridium sp.]MDU4938324.1 hypothetical protein [Clostridium sp.]
MSLEIFDYERNDMSIYEQCQRCMSYHTIIQMKDGSSFDGIVEGIDGNVVFVLVGEDVMTDEKANEMTRQPRQPFGPMRNRYRRFRRRPFPINAIAALALLRYPFIVPPYPYYPYYPY